VLLALDRVAPDQPLRIGPATGPMLSDCDGALREVVIHYLPEADAIVWKPYQEFLRQLPAGVRVHVICPDRAGFGKLARALGSVSCRLVPVITGHAMTCWSRDRWLALPPVGQGGTTTLLRPQSEDGAQVWPAREGDYRTAADLADSAPGKITAARSDLSFDGGDFVSDADTVFVTPDVIRRNSGLSIAQLRKRLEAMLGKRVVLLRDAPRHHAGMFMMPVGGKRVLVGDPSLAGGDLKVEAAALIGDIDESAAAQGTFDAVAAACRAEGYQVTRIPVVPGRDGRTYLSYVNVIIDNEGAQPVVYLPTFTGAGKLNEAATRVWEGLGYDVRPVDCTSAYRSFGTLRCLVNVLSRGETRRGGKKLAGRWSEAQPPGIWQ